MLACVAVAAVSLLGPWALAFDPQAWVVWGRDVLEGRLDTSTGPSWKPLPLLFTTPFAATDDLAPALWLIVARAAGLLAVAGAARLAWQLAGPAAAVGAAAAMLLSPWWAYNTALGNSEGMLAAAVLWAFVAHREERRVAACLLGLAAALLRPEAWLFVLVYGAWLWRRDPAARPAVALTAVALPLFWIGPDLVGVGGALEASHTALGPPTAGSAQLASIPALAVLGDAAELVTLPALAAAAVGVVTGDRAARMLAAAAAAWVVLVAAMTQAGYAGNPRYLVAAAAGGCVLAGVGVAGLDGLFHDPRTRLVASRGAGSAPTEGVRGSATVPLLRAPPCIHGPRPSVHDGRGINHPAGARWAAAAVLVALVAVVTGPGIRDRLAEVQQRQTLRRGLDTLVANAGGPTALAACGTPRTSLGLRAPVAWRLDVPMEGLDEPARPPGVILRAATATGGNVKPVLTGAQRRAFRLEARARGWELWTACR